MKDPKRWSDPAAGADAEVRALLQQAPQVAPSHSEASQIWAGLAPQLDIAHPPPGPSRSQPKMPGHGPQTALAAGTGALAGKVTLAVVLAAAVGAVGVRAIFSRDGRGAESSTTKADHRPSLPAASPILTESPIRPASATAVPPSAPREYRSRPERSARPRSVASASPSMAPAIPTQAWVDEDRTPPAPAIPAQAWVDEDRTPQKRAIPARVDEDRTPPAPAIPARRDEDRTPPERAADPRAAVEVTPPPEKTPISVNQLLQESRQLDRIRTALRADEPALALRLLRESAPKTTALAQEREELTIEAQAAIPALRAATVERARAFLRAYPGSPYRGRIKAIVFGSE